MSLPWVPVSERVPTGDEDVLICVCVFSRVGRMIIEGKQIYTGFYSSEDPWITDKGEEIPPGFMVWSHEKDDCRALWGGEVVTHWISEENASPSMEQLRLAATEHYAPADEEAK